MDKKIPAAKWLFILIFSFLELHSMAQKSIQVMTFNIRYDNPKDAPNDWNSRKDKVASQILFHEADIIGVQEALYHQLEDLKTRMKEFQYVGLGRDDGNKAGEYSPVFYNTKRLILKETSTFWLSQTPKVAGSKSWDAAITRIVTWARFQDKITKKEFYHFNTHFDHVGKIARRESAGLLLRAVDSIAGSTPSIITGDFNAQPTDEPIMVLLNPENPLKLTDTKSISMSPHYGPSGTYNAFGPKEVADQPIDFIFVKGHWKVNKHATFSETWGGLFSSDHFPVFANLELLK